MSLAGALWLLGVLLLIIGYNPKSDDKVQLWMGMSVLCIFVYYSSHDLFHYSQGLAFSWVALELYSKHIKQKKKEKKDTFKH
jgi:hypothetical protein